MPAVDHAQIKRLEEGAEAIGLRLDDEQKGWLLRHLNLVLKWNKSINLTAITDPDEAVEKHLIDSLALAPLLPAGTLLDAGSGAGFPGLPCAIARRDVEAYLVDSVQKKVAFLKSALVELRIPKVHAMAVRLQGDPARENLPRMHAAVARAFAAPSEWLKLAQHYILPAGLAICMMGPEDAAPERVEEMRLDKELAYTLPFSGARRRLGLYRRDV